MASLGGSVPMFRSLAPRFSKEFFTCRQCLGRTQNYATKSAFRKKFAGLSFGQKSSIASPNAFRVTATKFLSPISRRAVSGSAIAGALEDGASKAKSSFPKVSDKIVAYWLLGSAASVFGIVVFGGLTRLTESGLSITEWRPVTGSLPPMNAEDWESEFSKYRASPEFQLLNPNMSLSEFKSIYYMEWIHRLWGRFVGLSFVLPAIYFVAKKKVSKPMALRLAGIAGLIGFQGFIGWWMVKSGLKEDLFAQGSHPRVSQYRLTAHLGAAFVCYVAMLWNGLAILRSHRLLADPEAGIKLLDSLRDPKLKIFRRSVAGLALLVFATAMSGALVAGLDAGLIYNEFPFMGNGLAPPKSELFDERYSRHEDRSDLWWRNMLENPSLVQLDHRIMAMTTFTSIMALWAYSRRSPTMKRLLPPAARKGLHGVVAFAWVQVGLGISTLLYLVPTPLASAHQAGSLFLLTWVLVLGSRIWHPSRTAKLLEMAAKARGQAVRNATAQAHKL
ncbi:electron transfer protein 1, mitochondrial [Aspergillus lentulus]|uniref:Electron transfer protein 1, mitochondrial n=1 Tax=Aspergillus lentulus TaxID=293939 RepID=A0AAN4T744_ASPLE|nr:electron transfer protein 1, mitochondrial [Aspergillus lentulus]GAQ03374.1 electron transfer protein 1, mitochondrial [Aspergillus lentulus]GFF27549.1 electron transfer protein 1, mitochondrial [Aspergillus lentulus]GFF48349.1 electron transfer protein 1, mitochondrial [Aspergillus lentulus]GFF82514.1 electron transfer protein 1, mitochondrial [Aspergillus lentulus]GFF87182.1 electron transfer protein 1, mitochondrial [Aspergillus lentulus]